MSRQKKGKKLEVEVGSKMLLDILNDQKVERTKRGTPVVLSLGTMDVDDLGNLKKSIQVIRDWITEIERDAPDGVDDGFDDDDDDDDDEFDDDFDDEDFDDDDDIEDPQEYEEE